MTASNDCCRCFVEFYQFLLNKTTFVLNNCDVFSA